MPDGRERALELHGTVAGRSSGPAEARRLRSLHGDVAVPVLGGRLVSCELTPTGWGLGQSLVHLAVIIGLGHMMGFPHFVTGLLGHPDILRHRP